MADKQKALSLSKRVLMIVAIAMVVYLLFLFFAQKTLIYRGAYFDNPSLPKKSVLNLEQIGLVSPDGQPIKLYKLAGKEENKKALLLFHGNADTAPNILNRLYNPYVLYYGYDMYAMEYRGYDGMPGSPSEKGILMDSLTALEYIKAQKPYQTVVYYGHSLGTGVAVNLAKVEQPSGLVLEAPFSSLKDLASAAYPSIPRPLVNLIVRENYNSLETLHETEIPNLLILHAKNDNIIPWVQGKALFEAAKSPHKLFKNYESGGHVDIYLVNEIGDFRNFLLELN